MKPPKFEYFDPRTVDDALALLSTHGDEATAKRLRLIGADA